MFKILVLAKPMDGLLVEVLPSARAVRARHLLESSRAHGAAMVGEVQIAQPRGLEAMHLGRESPLGKASVLGTTGGSKETARSHESHRRCAV